MPSKTQENWDARRTHVLNLVDRIFKHDTSLHSLYDINFSLITTVYDAYVWIAENERFCSVRQVYNMVKPYNQKQTRLDFSKVKQTTLKY